MEADKLRVLLTNDDGIAAAGLLALEAAFKQAGAEVVVAAPDAERSGSSHGVTLRRPLLMKDLGNRRYAVSGTPVDAAHFAVNFLMKDRKPDLLISGINRGANLGCDIHYSGTVAAAREGAMCGVTSFAISLETFQPEPEFGPAARFAVALARSLPAAELLPRTFLNVNLPDCPPEKIKGIRITVQGIRNYNFDFQVQDVSNGDKTYRLGESPNLGGENIPESDIVAVREGWVSITPLRLDTTQEESLEPLRELVRRDRLESWK